MADRPQKVSSDLFKGKVIRDSTGAEQVIDVDLAQAIYEGLITSGYAKKGVLTDKYHEDRKNGAVEVAEEAMDCTADIIAILDTIYDSRAMQPENARSNNVELKLEKAKLESAAFRKLWTRINAKSAYVVDFDTNELVKKSIAALNKELIVSKIYFKVETGSMEEIASREALQTGAAFTKKEGEIRRTQVAVTAGVKYDLLGKIVAETGLTRAAVACILQGLAPDIFDQFKSNPEDFILKASNIINDQKATVIIQHIAYNKLESAYDTSIFTEPTMKGQLGVNAMATNKHLYDHLLYDSSGERQFATDLDASKEVAIYVKLPGGFYISTPVGKYNPDWAISFNEGNVKHIYFVAETKGSMQSMQLREIEKAKIHCAREHFKAISTADVVYDVVDNYESLMNKVLR